jgi:hypothetical protein
MWNRDRILKCIGGIINQFNHFRTRCSSSTTQRDDDNEDPCCFFVIPSQPSHVYPPSLTFLSCSSTKIINCCVFCSIALVHYSTLTLTYYHNGVEQQKKITMTFQQATCRFICYAVRNRDSGQHHHYRLCGTASRQPPSSVEGRNEKMHKDTDNFLWRRN